MDVSFFTAIFLLNLKVMIRTVIIKNLVCLSARKGIRTVNGFFFYYNKIHQYKNLIVKLDRERGKYEEIKKDVISNDSV